MPEKLGFSAKAMRSKLKEIMIGIGAAAAFIAALVGNFQNIVDFFKSSENVKIGWLTVEDPATLKKCIFVKGSNVFKLSGERKAQLASNPCLMDLRAILFEKASSATPQLQKIQKSYFLLVENQGEQIDRLLLKSARGSSDQDMLFRSIDKGASIAICMGYDGLAGNPSRMDSVLKVDVKRDSSTMGFSVEVPKREEGTPVGVSECGPIVWHYPPE